MAFIIAMMAGLILPAIGHYRAHAQIDRTRSYVRAIGDGLGSYKQEFGDYPPSEPDRVDWTDRNIKPFSMYRYPNFRLVSTNDLRGYYGSASLLLYLNGAMLTDTDASGGYTLADDTFFRTDFFTWYMRTWPPRVSSVPISDKTVDAPRRNDSTDFPPDVCPVIINNLSLAYRRSICAGFIDAWGNPIEYFRACRTGTRTNEVFPRAVNCAGPWPSNAGRDDYCYRFSNGVEALSPGPIWVGVLRWLDGHDDYSKQDWPSHSQPVNAGSYLLVSPGPDGVFGTADDIGNW